MWQIKKMVLTETIQKYKFKSKSLKFKTNS